jgi:hypothetical protein
MLVRKILSDVGRGKESLTIQKAYQKYYCHQCNSEVDPEDKFCPKCGADLSKVGRAIKLEVYETLNLSDNNQLSTKVSGSIATLSGDIVTSSSIIEAIPKEKREEIGINPIFMQQLERLKLDIQDLQNQPIVKIDSSTINAPIIISRDGNVITLSTDVNERFDSLDKEIDKMQVDSSIKAVAKELSKELREEIQKENPDIPKVRKNWAKLNTLAPLAVAVVQIGAVIVKVLLGSP